MELVNFIHHSLSDELSESLKLGKSGFSLLKREQKIHLEYTSSPASGQLYLVPLGLEFTESNAGQTHSEEVDGTVYVFRSPNQINAQFHLFTGDHNRSELFSLAEKLSQALFDKKSIQAFIPEGFEKYPKLYASMKNMKAKLLIERFAFNSQCSALDVKLRYLGPYHSGNFLRKDKRVEKRDIRFSPDS